MTRGCVWHAALGPGGEEKGESSARVGGEAQGCSRCSRSSVHLLLAAQTPPLAGQAEKKTLLLAVRGGSAALLLHPSACLLPLSSALLRNYFLGTDSELRPK